MATTYSDVFYRRSLAGNTNITALTLQGNASVPALTVTGGSIYANTSSANIANVLISSVGGLGYISFSSPGLVTAPVITFSGELTGLYKAGTGQVALTSTGVNSAVFATNTNGGSSINSNLTVSNVLTAANVNASNVYVTGNATVTQIITAANVNATANIYTNVISSPYAYIGNLTVLSALSCPTTLTVTTVNAFALNTAGLSVQGNADVSNVLTVANLSASANIYTTGPITTAGILTAANVNSANARHAFGMTVGNIVTGTASIANLSVGNITSTGTAQLNNLSGTSNQIYLDSGGVTFAGGVATFGPATVFNNGLSVGGGQIVNPSGTQAAPSYSFTGSLGTGMYCNAANQLSLSAGNTKVATFTSTGATFTNAVTASSNLSVGGDLTVTGNLTISGNTTTVNTTQLTVADPVLVVNSGSLASAGGMYIQGNTLTTQANVVVAYNPTSKFIEMYNTSSNSTVNTFTNTGYANIRANTITLDSSLLAVSLMANYPSDQGTGLGSGYVASSNSKSTYVSLLSNGKIVAMAFNPDSDNTTDPGSFSVFGTMQSQDLLVSNVAGSSTVLIRTCDGGAFDAIGNTHIISIQGAILKQNPATVNSNIIGSGTGQAGTAFNNIMGTLYVSTSNLMLGANAKAGHATISVLKLAGAAEMDIMPVSVHQSTLCNVFTVGKSSVSDNGNVVITTDSDCAITWQFYGSAY